MNRLIRILTPPRPYPWKQVLGTIAATILLIAVLAKAPGLLYVLAALGFYFLPTIMAFQRKVSSVGSVAVINVLLGWTIIGWIVALAMAARDPKMARAK